ncbi:hypothetical protein OMK64_15005, partial [Cellulomonas fimi]|uniref:endonuclease/exonuclease/phosphatase family protein n=1 Tax=Cellulomonas fimi TaxID=1708 RepID=UPI00236D0FFD|nr:hypothetical protein [Cellulomonas fimi]
ATRHLLRRPSPRRHADGLGCPARAPRGPARPRDEPRRGRAVGGVGGTAGAQAGLAGLLDAAPDGPPTYPAVDARHRIDVVLHDAGLRVAAAHVRDDALVQRASDHRPLVVDLEPSGQRGST